MAKGVVIVSGGMDSVTLAHMLAELDELVLVSFDYGQRHVKEVFYANMCAQTLGVKHIQVDIPSFGKQLTGSALTDKNVKVPFGHYEEESMKVTVVPNRNMIMLSMAIGIAVAKEADYVATAVHAGDHAIYPDCRPEFIASVGKTARIANEGFCKPSFEILAPFVAMTKAQIVATGTYLWQPVDYSNTWSCYVGGIVHCGKCGTCVERREAFSLAGIIDPTEYANV